MRISQINFNYVNFSLNAQSRQYKINEPLKADTFSRSGAVSFKGLDKQNIEKVEEFSDDLYKLLFKKNKCDLESIQKIVQKFDKDLAVRPLSEAQNAVGCAAVFDCGYDINFKNFEVKSNDKILYLNDKKPSNLGEMIELYTSAIHEFTHSLQLNNEDTSQDAIRTSYLRNSSDKSDAIFNIRHCHMRSNQIERLVVKPLLHRFDGSCDFFNRCITMGLTDEDILNGIYSIGGTRGVDSFVRQNVNEYFDDFEKRQCYFDKKFNLEYAAMQLENEKEACKNECKAYERFNYCQVEKDIYYATFMAELYSMASKTLKQMAKEC